MCCAHSGSLGELKKLQKQKEISSIYTAKKMEPIPHMNSR